MLQHTLIIISTTTGQGLIILQDTIIITLMSITDPSMCLAGMCLLIITTGSIILTDTITTTGLTMGLITEGTGGKFFYSIQKIYKEAFFLFF